jgi:biopolymer transport protein ExbD
VAKRKHAEMDNPKPAVPVVPMLDMAFQLLFFFIFTFHPDSQYEVEMDLALPQNEAKGQAAKPEEVDPTLTPNKDPNMEDLTDAPTVNVLAANDPENFGYISSITIDRLGSPVPVANPKELTATLKNDFKDEAVKGAIKLRCDSRLKWYAVLEMMDACHAAGFTRVGFAAPPDPGGN